MIEFPQVPPTVEAARSFLEHPERHSTAELELARQRFNEAIRVYCEQVAPIWQQISQTLQVYFAQQQQPIMSIVRNLLDTFGLNTPPTPSYLSHHPHKRALLRAARRRAHQSVQARHLHRRAK